MDNTFVLQMLINKTLRLYVCLIFFLSVGTYKLRGTPNLVLNYQARKYKMLFNIINIIVFNMIKRVYILKTSLCINNYNIYNL